MSISCTDIGKFGRIGNQLFQIAAVIGLAKKYNTEAKFLKWYCKYSNKTFSDYFKNKLDQTLDVNTIKYTYNEIGYNYNDIQYRENMNLHGYFQSEKYFEHCKDLIRFYFAPNEGFVSFLKKKWDLILMTNTCSVHIRRGDYVNNKVHDICNLNYYKTAIERALKELNIENFVIFSDDIKWCNEMFGDQFIYVENQSEIEDLFLMSLCNHHIICNSSFSWWGSYLNKSTSKVIYAPSKWFDDSFNKNYNDVYTKEMIKINI